MRLVIALIALQLFGCAAKPVITRIPAAPAAGGVIAKRERPPEKGLIPRYRLNNWSTLYIACKRPVLLSEEVPIPVGKRDSYFTAVALTTDGYMLTCRHCVEGASDMRLELSFEGKNYTYGVEVVFLDDENDLAVIKVRHIGGVTRLPANVILSQAPGLEIGAPIYTVSNPLQHGEGLFRGHVVNDRYSYVSEEKKVNKLYQAVRVNIVLAPGSSGSPIFSELTGEFVALAVAMDRQLPHVGMAVPVAIVRAALDKRKIPYFISK